MTFRGWLLDLYLNQEEGLTLWFIGEDDRTAGLDLPQQLDYSFLRPPDVIHRPAHLSLFLRPFFQVFRVGDGEFGTGDPDKAFIRELVK